MFTFFDFKHFFKTLFNLFSNQPNLWVSLISFGALFFALLVFFVVRLFCAKARGTGATLCLALSFGYFFVDLFICMSAVPHSVWVFAQQKLYAYCLLKLLVLLLLCGAIGVQGVGSQTKRCPNKAINSTFVGNCKPKTLAEAVVNSSPKNPPKQIEERMVCPNGGVYQREDLAKGLDLNVGYCLSVIQAVEQKNITEDEREFLRELKLKVMQAYFCSPEQLRGTNKGLEALLKLVAKYDAI